MLETPVVEIDDIAQARRRAVRKIRRTRGEAAKLLDHDRADVLALARDQRASRVLRIDRSAEKRMRRQIVAARDLEQRQLGPLRGPRALGRLERPGMVRGPEIHPAVGRVHARHVHAVTGCAGAFDRIAETDRIDVHRIADPERPEEEHVVAALHGIAERIAPALRRVAGFGQVGPFVFHGKDEARWCWLPSTPSAPSAIARGPRPEGPSGAFKSPAPSE